MTKLFAIPTENEKLCVHFGHCEKFTIIETVEDKIVGEVSITPPVHQPGVYPAFLAKHGVDVIISGGMGQKALDLFSRNNIEVCMGVDEAPARELVQKYLSGDLKTGQNQCDH